LATWCDVNQPVDVFFNNLRHIAA